MLLTCGALHSCIRAALQQQLRGVELVPVRGEHQGRVTEGRMEGERRGKEGRKREEGREGGERAREEGRVGREEGRKGGREEERK